MSNLWYYRHNREEVGPVPRQAIERYVVLGRLAPDDSVRAEGSGWMKISDSPDFASVCRLVVEGDDEKLAAARRFADERNHARRTEGRHEGRGDRRSEEPEEILELRTQRENLFVQHAEKNSWMGYLLIACLVGLVLLAIVYYNPVNPIKIALPRH